MRCWPVSSAVFRNLSPVISFGQKRKLFSRRACPPCRSASQRGGQARRLNVLLAGMVTLALCCLPTTLARAAVELRVATFRCDITPPLGQPMFSCDALSKVEQPLLAKGIVLEAGRATLRALCPRLVRAMQWLARRLAEQDCGRRRRRGCPRGGANRSPAHRAAGRRRRPKTAGRSRPRRGARRSEGLGRDPAASGRGREDNRSSSSNRSIRSARGRPRSTAWRRAAGHATRRARSAPALAAARTPHCGRCPRERSIPT